MNAPGRSIAHGAASAGSTSRAAVALRQRAGQRAGEDRLGDAGDRDAEVERGLHGPAAGALLAGLVDDDVDERLAGRGVDVAQHLGGDLDQERLQVAGVPLGEDVGDLGRARRPGPGGAGRRPRRSAACRRTRCRCAPS